MPELKMEWHVSLPGGQTYGPFNVLAVPHLVQNGILPADSRLTNMHSGKTLQVKELLKPTIAPAHEQQQRQAGSQLQQPAEQKQLETSTPLLQEAEVQRTIDLMSAYKKSQPAGTKPQGQTYFKEIAPAETVDQDAAAKATKLKDGLSRLNRETEQLRSRAEAAERELEAQKAEKENTRKQSAAREEQLKKRLEQAEKDLKVTREEILSTRQRISEGADTGKMAVKREQDLARALEETRKKAENDSAQLFKTKAQLEELRNQKAEIQNRSTQEENRLKSSIQDMDKLNASLNAELQTAKSHFHAQELEFQAKQERLQVLAGQSKEKADAATTEIEKLKKELQVQRSVNVDLEKSSTEKEAALLRETRAAKSAVTNAEAETGALRKQFENLRVQSSHKESDLQHKIDQLNSESRNWSVNTDQLRKELAAQQEESRRLEKRAKNLEGDVEKAQAAIRQLQEQLLISDARNKKQAEELARVRADLDNERRSLSDNRNRQLDEKNQLISRAEQLQMENKNIMARLQDNEKQLTMKILELETVQSRSAADRTAESLNAEKQLRDELQAARNELAAEKQRYIEEHDRLESVLKQAQENEQNSRRQLEDASASSAANTACLENTYRELSDALARIAQMEQQQSGNESGLRQQLARSEQKMAELEKSLEQSKNENQQQKEMYNTTLAKESKRIMEAQARVASLEMKLKEAGRPADAASPEEPEDIKPIPSPENFLANYSLTTITAAAALVILAVSIGMYFAGKNSADSTTVPESGRPAQTGQVSADTGKQVKTKPVLPRINVDRVKTTYSETSCTIVFDFPFFTFMTNLTSDAAAALEEIAAQIGPSLKDYKLIIDGHTDSVKMSSAATVSDNYALGLARANKVIEILKNRFNLPADSMEAFSSGEKDPPFPNTDDTLRKKNRTVVLKLVPR